MSTNEPIDADRFQAAFAKSMHEYWLLFLIEGTLLLILGLLAIVIPPLATLGVTIFLGWLFLISGIMGLVTTFWARHAPRFWWSLVLALLGIGAGVALLAWPVSGPISLTLVLIVFFVIEGIASIMYALEYRQEFSGHWGWMLLSGIIDLILSIMLFDSSMGAWTIGGHQYDLRWFGACRDGSASSDKKSRERAHRLPRRCKDPRRKAIRSSDVATTLNPIVVNCATITHCGSSAYALRSAERLIIRADSSRHYDAWPMRRGSNSLII